MLYFLAGAGVFAAGILAGVIIHSSALDMAMKKIKE